MGIRTAYTTLLKPAMPAFLQITIKDQFQPLRLVDGYSSHFFNGVTPRKIISNTISNFQFVFDTVLYAKQFADPMSSWYYIILDEESADTHVLLASRNKRLA